MHQVLCEQSVSGAGPVPSFPAGKQRGTEGNTTRVTPSGNAASGEGSCGGTRRESRRAEPGGGATCRNSPVPPRPVLARLPALQGSRYSAGSSCGGSSCRADSAAPRPAGPGAGRRRSDSSRRRSGAAPRPMAVARRGTARLPGLRALHGASSPAPAPAGRPAAAGRSAAGGRGAGGGHRPAPSRLAPAAVTQEPPANPARARRGRPAHPVRPPGREGPRGAPLRQPALRRAPQRPPRAPNGRSSEPQGGAGKGGCPRAEERLVRRKGHAKSLVEGLRLKSRRSL